MFKQAIFIKVTRCSPEFHSKRVPLQLFFVVVVVQYKLHKLCCDFKDSYFSKPQNFKIIKVPVKERICDYETLKKLRQSKFS